MGQSESITQEILTTKISQMSGQEVLEAAGGIYPNIQILPDKSDFNFGEHVTGKVVLKLNKPIFFLDEGMIQLTLEGKEIFSFEENNPISA